MCRRLFANGLHCSFLLTVWFGIPIFYTSLSQLARFYGKKAVPASHFSFAGILQRPFIKKSSILFLDLSAGECYHHSQNLSGGVFYGTVLSANHCQKDGKVRHYLWHRAGYGYQLYHLALGRVGHFSWAFKLGLCFIFCVAVLTTIFRYIKSAGPQRPCAF